MQNKSDLPDEKARELVEGVLEDPGVQQELLNKMKGVYATWAVENHQAHEINKLVKEFKVIIAACINAKTGVDPRNVLLALDYLVVEWAMGMVKELAKVVVNGKASEGDEDVVKDTTGWKQ